MLELADLNLTGTGAYDIGITLEPVPHVRGGRVSDEEAEAYRLPLVHISGGTLMGANSGSQNSFEVNLYAPDGIEDYDGDSIILASFEFHSLQVDFARGPRIGMVGYLSGAYAYTQDVYDTLADISTQEEYEAVSAITNSVGRIHYMAPKYEPAERFMGWKANIALRPAK